MRYFEVTIQVENAAFDECGDGNEVARILHYLLAHMGGQVPSVSRRCCGADDDDMDANTPG